MNCCGANTEVGWDPDEFYAIRPECAGDVPPSHFRPKPGKTLSARRWHASFSEDGHLDIAKVLSRIQRGGIHPTIKGSVWEFLLGCYDPNSTFGQRTQLRQHRRSEYDKLKSKCKEMEPTIGSGKLLTMPVITGEGYPIENPSSVTSQENPGRLLTMPVISGDDHPIENSSRITLQENPQVDENSSIMPEQQRDNVVKDKDIIQWKLLLSQIGLDVIRTDRTLVYYESEQNRARLWDVLAVYAWIDKDIGYCQGMSDLCSPISILLENEADAFWCFERLMRRLRANFKCTGSSIGVRSQLTVLSAVIKTVDAKLHRHLGCASFYVGALHKLVISTVCHTLPSLVVNLQGNGEVLPATINTIPVHLDLFKLNSCEHMTSEKNNLKTLQQYAENLDGGEYLFAFRMLMVLFRREFSFVDLLYLWEMMWAMEYNPKLFSLYESDTQAVGSRGIVGNEKEYGKFERRNVKMGWNDGRAPLAVFVVASVLEAKNKRLLREAKGMDEVVKILNDITGKLDAKRACRGALKLHRKYLTKVKVE